MKKVVLMFVCAMLVSAGCVTLKPIEPVKHDQGTSVLYVFREDAAASMSDKIMVYLNDRKATEILEYDGYMALILKPGTYTIKIVAFNKKNEKLKEQVFTDVIKPTVKEYMCTFAYNFGWRGWQKFFEAEGKSVMMRFKYQGAVDLTKKIAPR